MNYSYKIPGAQANPNSFVADNTLILGTVDKPLDAHVQVSVDYSQVVPAITLQGYSFKVKPGGEPQLWIDESALGSPATSLMFIVSGGISGRAYEITINTKLVDGEIRSDTLNVNVLGDNCGCSLVSPSPISNGVVSGDGSIIVNQAPRFFISGTPPVGANVLDRWYDTATGNIWDYVSSGLSSFWALSDSSGGGGGTANILNITPIRPDGVTTTFTLTSVVGQPVTIAGSNTLFVSVDGVWQDATTQYTATNNQITFAQAPGADSVVFMLWFAKPSNP
jgi:hypothetical protein